MSKQQNPTGNRRWIIGGIIVIALIGLVSAPTLFGVNSMHNRDNWPTQFQSNGERIYFTATSSSGLAITARGGDSSMGMMGAGCVTCHGADRQGARLMHSFWKTTPPLTSDALFKEDSEDGHGDHDGYSEDSLGRAITQGIEPGGKPLDQAMPRWSMSKQDLDDLISFLKTTDVRP